MDIITVYFLYGLSFFSMGLAVLLEVGRSSKLDYARALRPLAGFGLVHGCHEWLEMFFLIYYPHVGYLHTDLIAMGRILLLALSFFLLIEFGARLITGPGFSAFHLRLQLTIAAIWLVGLLWVFIALPQAESFLAADTYTRYALAIPGAALTAWGLVLQQRRFLQSGMHRFGNAVVIAAAAFGLYGGVGQLFVTQSMIFPSQFINSTSFLEWFGFPVQLFRSVMACVAAIAITSSLRSISEETRLQIETLRESQAAEQRRLEALRAELLRRTVRAQESERQRIARELHDELGQTLTALGLGLRAISRGTGPLERLREQASEMETLVEDGFAGLQNLISGLHPPQLDDFGLLATLRWYAQEVRERYGITVELSHAGDEPLMPTEVRVVLFRIIQEGLTNVIRHAGIDRASVRLIFSPEDVTAQVSDDGEGFDVAATLQQSGHPCWGLLGMQERAALVDGTCSIASQLGAGTLVEVTVPLTPKVSINGQDTPAPGR